MVPLIKLKLAAATYLCCFPEGLWNVRGSMKEKSARSTPAGLSSRAKFTVRVCGPAETSREEEEKPMLDTVGPAVSGLDVTGSVVGKPAAASVVLVRVVEFPALSPMNTLRVHVPLSANFGIVALPVKVPSRAVLALRNKKAFWC